MILVDAYNVLGVEGVLEGEAAGLDLRGLIALISGSRLVGKRVVLVCDGAASPRMPAGRVGFIEVVYAGGGRDADSLIARMLGGSGASRGALVVSSDRAVRAAARRAGAKDVSSEEFLAGLGPSLRPGRSSTSGNGPRRSVPLGADAVRAWIDEFGLCASDLLSIAGTAAGARQAPVGSGEAPASQSNRRPAQAARDAGLDRAWVPPSIGLDPSDLDMARWVDGVTRLRRRDP